MGPSVSVRAIPERVKSVQRNLTEQRLQLEVCWELEGDSCSAPSYLRH